LDEMEFSSPGWLARFRAMRDRYEHHIDEEEEEMFPDAAKELTDAEEARLTEVFKRRKPAELERAK
ncbi:MAG: hemerythrin domain-containing protein, partial [Sphingobium sp.]